MAIKGLSLKESMNKNVQAIMPIEEEKNEFQAKLINYLENLSEKNMNQRNFKKTY